MKRRNRDYSQVLILSAILVTVARYIGAFLASDLGEITGWVSDGITILMGITGLGMGILDVLGGAYIFDGWRRSLPASGKAWSSRFKVQTVFVFALFVVGVGILIPFTVSRVEHDSMSKVLGDGLWWWSGLVNIAPYLLIGGVVTSQSGVIGIQHGESQAVSYPEKREKYGNNDPSQSSVNDWRLLPEEDRNLVAQMSTVDIAQKYGLSERTARNWRKSAQNGNHRSQP